MADFDIINTKLLSHPVNWGIVWATLLIVMFGYTVVHNRMIQQAQLAADQSIIPD